MAEGVELATAWVSIVPSAKGIGAQLGTQIAGPVAAASTTASRTMTQKLGAGAAAAGKAMKIGLFAGVATIGLVGAGLIKVGSDFQGAFKTIRVETGATGAKLRGLEGDFKSVLSQRPDNMEDVARAVTDLNKRLGLSGPLLQKTAVQQLRLAAITKTDLATNIEATSKLFTQYGIKGAAQGPKLDELFRASQRTGIGVAELATGMIGAGPVTRQLGLSFEESAGFLGVLSKAGIDASTVMAPLSKTVAAAAKSGKNAGDVFRDTFTAIRNAPTDTAAAAAAIATFGARAGPKFAELIRSGKLSYGELVGQIKGGTDTIEKAAKDTSTFSGKWKTFKNAVLVSIQPIATKVFNTVGNLMAAAAPHLILFATWLRVHIPLALKRISVAVAPVVAWLRARLPDALDRARAGFATIVGFASRVAAGFRVVAGAVSRFVGANPTPVIVGIAAAIATILIPALVIWTINTWLAVAAQVALWAPVILVVAGIALLAAGVVYAYQHFEVFRNVVDAVARFLRDKVWPAIKVGAAAAVVAFKGIATGAQWLWTNVLSPVFQAVGAYIHNVIIPAFNFWKTVVQIAVAAIGAYISIAWATVIHPVFTFVSAYLRNVVVPAFRFLWNVAVNIVFPAIAAAIRVWWSVASAVFGFVAPIVGRLITTFVSMKDRVVGVFDVVKSAILTAKNFISDRVGDIVGIIVGIKDRVVGVFDGVKELLTAPFRLAVDAIKSLWNRTIGGKGFHAPSWVPVVGGKGFTFPTLHGGGVVPGPRGREVTITALGGEVVYNPMRGDDLPPPPAAGAMAWRGPLIGQFIATEEADVDRLTHRLGFNLATRGLPAGV